MTTTVRPTRIGAVGMLISAAGLALAIAACDSAVTPTQGVIVESPVAATPAATTPAPATPAPTASPSPTPTAAPSATPVPTPSASAQASATPSPSPSIATTTIEDYAWVYEKRPLSLSGTAGTTTWTRVLFGAQTVSLKWTATPAADAGCVLRYKVTSKSMAKPVAGTSKAKGSTATTGSRAMTVKYGDGIVTVTTDCAKFSLRVVSTSHPKVTIKQSNDPYKVTGTTATELNEGLAKAYAAWSFRTSTKYYAGGTVRVSSFTVRVPVEYKLPKWTPPEGTDQALIDDWNAALKNMRKHVEGEAAIGIQAAGRYMAATTKKTFGSVSAMSKYQSKVGDKWIDWASDKTETYNEVTDYGNKQGAFIQ